MLTSRAWWFLLAVLLVLSVGLLRPSLPLTVVALTLLLWFGGQWLLFFLRLSSLHGLEVEREVWDEKAPVATLWAGQTFEVHVRLTHSEWLATSHLAADDHVPYGVAHVDGVALAQGVVDRRRPLGMTYRIRCGPAGLARFEGVRVRAADAQGFFFRVLFVHAAVALPILPVLTQHTGLLASKKRHNLLMPPGIHRFRRPGSGSELLDLRDYLPGDPPKTIAWKVSARRDRLITKEFESEVPVRCTLFVDTSNSVRVPGLAGVGPRQVNYGKALDRLIDLAAGILQVNARIRDLTGLCLFDEHGIVRIAPGRGGTHLTEGLRRLADAAARMPYQERAEPDALLPLAYSFAQEVYPELLRPSVNSVPFGMRWRDGFSGYSHRFPFGLFEMILHRRASGRPRLLDLLHRRKHELRGLCWWVSLGALLLPLALFLAKVILKARISDDVLGSVLFLAPLISLLLWAGAALLFALDTVSGRGKRRRDRWRKQLAAILSARYGLAPGGLGVLLEDDDAFARLSQRFLSEHHVPYSLPLYDSHGRYLFAAPEKIPVLADALLGAVARGRDNELFVLLADLLELDDGLEPLLCAIRVALGRHHQVILICPWPPGLPLPGDNPGIQAAASLALHGRSHDRRPSETTSPHTALWDQVTTHRFHLAYQRLRRTFTRLGVAVLCAAGDEPIPLILSRLERLRTLGRPHS
jgi:uncharacterized protein (DUF58 family)